MEFKGNIFWVVHLPVYPEVFYRVMKKFKWVLITKWSIESVTVKTRLAVKTELF